MQNANLLLQGSSPQLQTSTKPKLPKLWLLRGRKSYKAWANQSDKGKDFVLCSFCHQDILVALCYGDHCHQLTKKHLDNEKEWRKNHPEAQNFIINPEDDENTGCA